MQTSVALSADLIESFAGTFISPRYDNRAATPQMHREAWELYASAEPQVMCIAPREHAKSTALTTVYILAEVLFRNSDYVMLVGSTEEFAAEQLGNISDELRSNHDLIDYFGVQCFEMDSRTDIIVVMKDGHKFRILCRGAEQRIRGRLWKGKRPNLLVGDDLEDDEQVENADRRMKFRRWFFRAAKQALGRYGKTRLHGTILHDDSLLSRTLRCPNPECKHLKLENTPKSLCVRCGKEGSWKHLYYKAHAAFDDFSDILWPQQWPEARLRARRQEFIDSGDAAGYSQEFLNDPLDNSEAFLKVKDFLPMSEDDYESQKIICASADFAVSRADKANRTAFVIGGKDVNNILHHIDFRAGRWDPTEWIDQMFDIQKTHSPQVFWVEDGVIWKSLRSMIYREMQTRDIRINFEAILPVKDKGTRGRPFQRRMRAGQCRFDKRHQNYYGFEQEAIRFTGTAAATLDDYFDAAALLSRGFDDFAHVEVEDFFDADDWEMEKGFWNHGKQSDVGGRSRVTGY